MENKSSNSILKTSGLSIGYSERSTSKIIAENIDFEIDENELTAVIGVNGAGKSTLLKTLSRSLEPLKGEVIVNNKNISNISSEELSKQLSLVLTEQHVSRNLSAQELIALGRQPYTNWIGKLDREDKEAVQNAIELVNIKELANRKCYELSDGQFQKVLIARAIAQDTSLIILDEPTTHLDIYHKAFMLKLLKQLTEKTGKAIIFATHEINLAIQLCDKLIILKDGKSFTGTPKELMASGVFDSLFPSELITFDRQSASFRISS
ncbi:ABC transporter ATP-binding protein [Christiangramia sp. LLG6405-1]|uniref:ABC transporter ATP-binding protein n=1 Tax=Christiangramia sp. LLG6405-1 TaxID=3160832 RepID=UPI00386DCBBD